MTIERVFNGGISFFLEKKITLLLKKNVNSFF